MPHCHAHPPHSLLRVGAAPRAARFAQEFTVVLSDIKGEACFDAQTDGGKHAAVATVTIVNDDERAGVFQKAMVLLNVNYDMLDLGAATYQSQFRALFEIEGEKTIGNVLSFLLVWPWKLLLAFVPPAPMCGGWACFVGALVAIAIQVILIADFASQMGCQMGLKDSVTAITFVALGTSLPDTFASMQAATGDKTADNAIGNVTGSNSVNVFFGLGLPWLIAALYWANADASTIADWRLRYAHVPGLVESYPNGAFVVLGGGLGFSVVVFTCCAVATIGIILMRRQLNPPAELGGNKKLALATSTFLVLLWFVYVILSSLKAYEDELGLAPFGF
jgi:hypothetical protein